MMAMAPSAAGGTRRGRTRRGWTHLLVVVALVVGGIVAIASPAYAVGKSWNGSLSTEWNTAGNWTPSGVPGIGDDVSIPAGLTNYPVVSTAAANAKTLTLA